MKITFAVAIVAVLFAGSAEISQASPIAPLPQGVANEASSGNLTRVWCRWGRCGWGWRGAGWRYRGYYGYGGNWCRWHPRACGW